MNLTIYLPDEAASQQAAQRLAACFMATNAQEPSPITLTFCGDIGAGKTTFIRALLRALGISASIKSPTFSLVESYETPHLQIHHFDLYRIHEETELEYIGFRDYFAQYTLCCIEWPERAPDAIEQVDVAFTLTIKEVGRDMQLQAFTPFGVNLLTCFLGES